jgi:hypothetical protein
MTEQAARPAPEIHVTDIVLPHQTRKGGTMLPQARRKGSIRLPQAKLLEANMFDKPYAAWYRTPRHKYISLGGPGEPG